MKGCNYLPDIGYSPLQILGMYQQGTPAKEEDNMANKSTKKSLERFKYEVADELGVPLSNGYNGNLTAKQNGSVGGYMVKKMIEAQEKQMAGGKQ